MTLENEKNEFNSIGLGIVKLIIVIKLSIRLVLFIILFLLRATRHDKLGIFENFKVIKFI
jgi:hypothetical protein